MQQPSNKFRRSSVFTFRSDFNSQENGGVDLLESKLSRSIESTGLLSARREKERRNSVATLWAFANRSNPSANHPINGPSSSQSSKYMKFYQYLKGGDQGVQSIPAAAGPNCDQLVSKLDDTFDQIRKQLSNLNESNRDVRDRIDSLTESIEELYTVYHYHDTEEEDEYEDEEECSSETTSEHSLAIERIHSQPPLVNGWHHDYDEDMSDNEYEICEEEVDWMTDITNTICKKYKMIPIIAIMDNDSDTS